MMAVVQWLTSKNSFFSPIVSRSMTVDSIVRSSNLSYHADNRAASTWAIVRAGKMGGGADDEAGGVGTGMVTTCERLQLSD